MLSLPIIGKNSGESPPIRVNAERIKPSFAFNSASYDIWRKSHPPHFVKTPQSFLILSVDGEIIFSIFA